MKLRDFIKYIFKINMQRVTRKNNESTVNRSPFHYYQKFWKEKHLTKLSKKVSFGGSLLQREKGENTRS